MGKGGDYEREVSKHLTCWLTGKEKPYAFWRMPGSGGLSTIHEENKNLTGDIIALLPEAEFLTNTFSIECKTGYPQTSFWQHFGRVKNFNIEIFWRQAFEDAVKGGKHPLLIYRKKGRKPVVGISQWISDLFKLDLPTIILNFTKEQKLPNLVLYDFNDFWEKVTPQKIKNERSKGL
jgi:hypothetical protein